MATKDNLFHFVSSKGEKFDVPYMIDAISFKRANALRKEYAEDQETLGEAMMNEALEPETAERIQNLSIRDFTNFMREWGKDEDAEGVSLGE